jgi:lipoyl(octanoyl) transferase
MTLEIKVSRKLVPYKTAFEQLRRRVNSIKKHKSKDLLWILEHPLTYTSGIRSKEDEVLDKKIKIIKTNRGGKITLHNPGQKIVYFAIDLNKRKKDIKNLVKNIEDSIIEFLNVYKINAYADKKNIGIWVNQKKIAAIGIRVSQWIAYHGCSININNSLDPYKKIVPCGLDNTKITSIKNENKINVKNVEKNLKKIFTKNLKNI